MIFRSPNPNDAIDLFAIEQQARALRAAATRDWVRSLRQWVGAKTAGLGAASRPLPSRG